MWINYQHGNFPDLGDWLVASKTDTSNSLPPTVLKLQKTIMAKHIQPLKNKKINLKNGPYRSQLKYLNFLI